MTDGTIVDRAPVSVEGASAAIVTKTYSEEVLTDTVVEKLTYASDGLRVKAYYARPKGEGTYPVILWNRGGFGDYGSLDDLRAYLLLASTARWGYAVIATQYRGNDGGEGTEDAGGEDVNDALNLLKAAENLDACDMGRVAIEGASRGGITTYRALSLDDRFRCAVVHAGISDLETLVKQKSDQFAQTMDTLFGGLPDERRREEYCRRSVVCFADSLPRTIPILLMHGTEDTRVPMEQTEALAAAFRENRIPHEIAWIRGGGHIALKDGSYREVDRHRRRWLQRYLG